MQIVYYPDPVLLKNAQDLPTEPLPENLGEVLEGMRHVMEIERGIGLAAPQVGLSWRLLLVNSTGEEDGEIVMINPKLKRFLGKKIWGEEGCLSFPGIWGEVLRHSSVEVEFVDETGQLQTLVADDLLARVIQHEVDHLDGKIFVNKMRDTDRQKAKSRLAELKLRFEESQAT